MKKKKDGDTRPVATVAAVVATVMMLVWGVAALAPDQYAAVGIGQPKINSILWVGARSMSFTWGIPTLPAESLSVSPIEVVTATVTQVPSFAPGQYVGALLPPQSVQCYARNATQPVIPQSQMCTIGNLEPNTNYVLTLSATNQQNEVYEGPQPQTFKTRFALAPGVPQIVSLLSQSAQAIRVQIRAPNVPGEPLTSVTLRARSTTDLAVIYASSTASLLNPADVVTGQSVFFEATLALTTKTGLVSSTAFWLTATVSNAQGDSNESAPLVMTMSDANDPPSAASVPVAVSVSLEHLALEWSDPVQTGGGPILSRLLLLNCVMTKDVENMRSIPQERIELPSPLGAPAQASVPLRRGFADACAAFTMQVQVANAANQLSLSRASDPVALPQRRYQLAESASMGLVLVSMLPTSAVFGLRLPSRQGSMAGLGEVCIRASWSQMGRERIQCTGSEQTNPQRQYPMFGLLPGTRTVFTVRMGGADQPWSAEELVLTTPTNFAAPESPTAVDALVTNADNKVVVFVQMAPMMGCAGVSAIQLSDNLGTAYATVRLRSDQPPAAQNQCGVGAETSPLCYKFILDSGVVPQNQTVVFGAAVANVCGLSASTWASSPIMLNTTQLSAPPRPPSAVTVHFFDEESFAMTVRGVSDGALKVVYREAVTDSQRESVVLADSVAVELGKLRTHNDALMLRIPWNQHISSNQALSVCVYTIGMRTLASGDVVSMMSETFTCSEVVSLFNLPTPEKPYVGSRQCDEPYQQPRVVQLLTVPPTYHGSSPIVEYVVEYTDLSGSIAVPRQQINTYNFIQEPMSYSGAGGAPSLVMFFTLPPTAQINAPMRIAWRNGDGQQSPWSDNLPSCQSINPVKPQAPVVTAVDTSRATVNVAIDMSATAVRFSWDGGQTIAHTVATQMSQRAGNVMQVSLLTPFEQLEPMTDYAVGSLTYQQMVGANRWSDWSPPASVVFAPMGVAPDAPTATSTTPSVGAAQGAWVWSLQLPVQHGTAPINAFRASWLVNQTASSGDVAGCWPLADLNAPATHEIQVGAYTRPRFPAQMPVAPRFLADIDMRTTIVTLVSSQFLLTSVAGVRTCAYDVTIRACNYIAGCSAAGVQLPTITMPDFATTVFSPPRTLLYFRTQTSLVMLAATDAALVEQAVVQLDDRYVTANMQSIFYRAASATRVGLISISVQDYIRTLSLGSSVEVAVRTTPMGPLAAVGVKPMGGLVSVFTVPNPILGNAPLLSRVFTLSMDSLRMQYANMRMDVDTTQPLTTPVQLDTMLPLRMDLSPTEQSSNKFVNFDVLSSASLLKQFVSPNTYVPAYFMGPAGGNITAYDTNAACSTDTLASAYELAPTAQRPLACEHLAGLVGGLILPDLVSDIDRSNPLTVVGSMGLWFDAVANTITQSMRIIMPVFAMRPRVSSLAVATGQASVQMNVIATQAGSGMVLSPWSSFTRVLNDPHAPVLSGGTPYSQLTTIAGVIAVDNFAEQGSASITNSTVFTSLYDSSGSFAPAAGKNFTNEQEAQLINAQLDTSVSRTSTCVVTNSAQTCSGAYVNPPTTPIGAPSNVNDLELHTSVGQRAIRVRWSAPSTNGGAPLTQFILMDKIVNANAQFGNRTVVPVTEQERYEFVLQDMEYDTMYTVSVRAENKAGLISSDAYATAYVPPLV